VLWRCWLGGRKGIRPVKNRLVGCWRGYLSEARCRLAWPSWCHCHSLSLASVKSRLVLSFWYGPTRVVWDKGPLNGCVCVYSLNNVRIPSSTLSNLSNSSLADCDAHLSQKTKFQCEQEIWFARQFFIAASEIGGPTWLNTSNMSEAKPVSILPQNHNFKSNEQQKTLHTRTKLNTPYTLHWPANQTSWIAELFTILQ